MSGFVIAAASAASAASAPIAASAPAAAASAVSGGMLAGAAAFIAGVTMSWVGLAILFVIGVLFEHNAARGWAIFTAIVAGVIAYFAFTVSLVSILIYAAGYILAGVIWSVWRYKRHVAKKVAEFKNSSHDVRNRVARELHPRQMLSTITAWIIVWPFSLVENITGDLITAIENLVTKIFRGVYHRIYNSAVAGLNIDQR